VRPLSGGSGHVERQETDSIDRDRLVGRQDWRLLPAWRPCSLDHTANPRPSSRPTRHPGRLLSDNLNPSAANAGSAYTVPSLSRQVTGHSPGTGAATWCAMDSGCPSKFFGTAGFAEPESQTLECVRERGQFERFDEVGVEPGGLRCES
jgi:hypothetical protein